MGEEGDPYIDRFLPRWRSAICEEYKSADKFLDHYQIMRNLVHIDQNSFVVFIYPEENHRIRNSALDARSNILEKGWENRFILFAWEDLLSELQHRLNDQGLVNYYKQDFSGKYFFDEEKEVER
ncbi:hypothetical protein Desdi_0191 [Desulfitobacterium dichloroeliminans LMG P-21439]|uniref:Uncharacterized protein n=1 Tax=Desulfitobacterium dichloroeliminans (strain LMG P-21439 / DCA1) TaxID=871963 RepID=L0F485_DESDL|nr:hypothetical protein [Desulfitobacterium dichloroeliminans]AGA67748.1 hypothetical protein Desdi_0191 [Desulfitobacterium dichloroeliminans LMG P-21439]